MSDPWFDPWSARLVSYDGRVLGHWRLPFQPPYSLKYTSREIRDVHLRAVEFLNHDREVVVTWDCKNACIGPTGWYQLNVDAYV